jgi:hypothetical protein
MRSAGQPKLCVGEATLDLLAEGIGVGDEERGRKTLGEVERVGDIDQHLPCEAFLAGRLEHRDRPRPARRVHDQLRCRARSSATGSAERRQRVRSPP